MSQGCACGQRAEPEDSDNVDLTLSSGKRVWVVEKRVKCQAIKIKNKSNLIPDADSVTLSLDANNINMNFRAAPPNGSNDLSVTP